MFHAIGLLTSVLLGAANPESAADAIVLRDGRVLLGQVIASPPRGKVVVLVRRAWAEKNLPDMAKRWEAAQAPSMKRARDQRRIRLEAWRKDRPKLAGKDDAVSDWLEREIDRLKKQDASADSTRLLAVSLNRAEIRKLTPRPTATGRLLRLAWRVNLETAESEPIDDLKAALEGRGYDPNGTTPVVVDDLLPIPDENEAHWRLRRAATEVANESALRFVRHASLVLPESATANDPGVGLDAIGSAIKSILGDEPAVDPLAARLAQVARSGRIGAVVTRMDIALESNMIRVESTLWVRVASDRWEPLITRPASVRLDEANSDEAAVVAGDPQVKVILGAVDSLGLGDLAPTLKNAGAATKRALGLARSELQQELDARVLPVTAGP
jgi:hypothetical protein